MADTKIDNTVVALCGTALESFTEIVNEEVPVVVGVPRICPVGAPSKRPAGNDPDAMDQV